MYEEYYGFVQPPFTLTPDPRFLYRSESHDVALRQIWQAIRRKEGFMVLTGDIGTGKTTICRTILEQFDQATFTALVLNPFLTVEELLREVLLSFGVLSKDEIKAGGTATASKHDLVRTLHDFLLSLVPLHGSAVLIIDEAQHLSTDVLEEIRILSNLETDNQKLLQILIVGQNSLLKLLHKHELRQLDQRISVRCALKPLNREEAEAYITHRLWVARASTSVSFTPEALDLVHAVSGGVPRTINLLCDRALMVGCEDRTNCIAESHVVQAATRIGLEVSEGKVRGDQVTEFAGPPNKRTRRLAAALVLVAAGGAITYYLGHPLELRGPTEMPVVRRTPTPSLDLLAAAPAPSGPTVIGPPPQIAESFSVLIGTFDTPRRVEILEAALRAQQLPVYLIDLKFAPGDIRRRVLVGRYLTREEADAVRLKLGPSINARVIAGDDELLSEIP